MAKTRQVFSRSRALELLRVGSGLPNAEFREGQEDAIRHTLDGHRRLLVVQKTGWGKSFVYFIATKLLREAGHGPTLLISPLLALMRNQIAAANRMGVNAKTINSDNPAEWAAVEQELLAGKVDVLLISPERLANERFRTQVLAQISARVALLVIDEAHCISDWGHDFRPHYRLLERMARNLPANLRLLATTATANERVMNDLTDVLGPNIDVSRGDLGRPSLALQTMSLPGRAERLAWLAQTISEIDGNGIVYTLTVRDALLVADWLQSRGLKVDAYTGESGDERPELEDALLGNKVKALVATMALGMGFDKPDLAFVIHYQMPGSVVAYYQQVGRAGRALDAAYGVLLSGEEDPDITDWFITSAFPSREEVALVIGALDESDGLSVPELLGRLNLRKGRVEKVLSLLSLESPSPIAKQGSKWQLTASELGKGFWQRVERITDVRRHEHAEMQDYLNLPHGQHMHFLVRALDGDVRAIGAPPLPELSGAVDPALVKEAIAFLRRTSVPLPPRKMWPAGGLQRQQVAGNIPVEHRAEVGRALSWWADGGWGQQVKREMTAAGGFSQELVDGCVDMIKKWNPQPSPTWVTCVPSLRNTTLVPEFAAKVAAALGLPFVEAIAKLDRRPQQKMMVNSIQQARNVDGAFGLADGALPEGPVLLIDDVANSGWTLTVCAWLLRGGGSGPVWPAVLSTTRRET